MRNLAPWDGRTLVDLGCGTGFWLPGYARDAARVIGVEPDPALRARAAARIHGLPRAEVAPGSGEHLPLADRSVDVVHARFAYFLTPASSAGRAGGGQAGAEGSPRARDAGLAEVMRVLDRAAAWSSSTTIIAGASSRTCSPRRRRSRRSTRLAPSTPGGGSAAPPGTRSGHSGASPAARIWPPC